MLKNTTLTTLQQQKNLLAFSGGGDSTALLFLLLEHNIPFDIAIVDYGLRLQSKEEVAYAKALAQRYNFTCHTLLAPHIDSNFEAKARAVRYDFFEQLIAEHHYTTLLTAHHLGDRFEWMLMQFCKGAGCVEMAGMQAQENKQNYSLIRPLLHLDKAELLAYLHKEDIHYFEDASNNNPNYKRNAFRHAHTQPLLKEYLSGIKQSFAYIDADVQNLIHDVTLHTLEDFAYFVASHEQRSDIYHIDQYLKRKGYLLSSHEKALLAKQQSVVIARKMLIVQADNYVFILPYVRNVTMNKQFKEEMRRLRIEPKMRPYLFLHPNVKQLLLSLL